MGIIDGQADKGKQIDDVGTRPHFCCTRCASQVISQCMPINIIRYETDHRAYRAVGISGGVDEYIMETHQVGMLKGSNRLRLVDEVPHDFGVRLMIRVEDFEKDVVLRVGIAG